MYCVSTAGYTYTCSIARSETAWTLIFGMTEAFHNLYWLPVTTRINFKLLIVTGSARPEVRGTAEPHCRAYPPSSPPPRTHSRRSSLPYCGRTGGDG